MTEGRSLELALGLLGFRCIDCDWRGGACESFLDSLLLAFSVANILPKVFPLPVETTDARSGLVGGLSAFFLDPDLNTSLMRAPGEIPRPSDSVSFVLTEALG